jgi:CelD/BcsL family acetyltransferase involved in cellulose biosynthesis
MSPPVEVALDEPASLGGLVGEWRELAGRLRSTSYFQTPDWILSWWESIGGRPLTRVAAWHGPSGRLEAIVALARDREPLHRRLPLTVPVYANAGSGAGAADHCGWLVPPERRAEAAEWISGAIGRTPLLVRNVDGEPGGPPVPGARVVERSACPRSPLPAAGPSREFRRQLGRFTRRLERAGMRFEWVPPGAVDGPLLSALFELHRRGRAARGAATRFGPEQLALHRRLADRSGPGRGPAAVVGRCDGAIAGVLYGFRWTDTFAAYQSGWDPAWSRDSIGSVLVDHAMRFAAADGARTFDFLRGGEAYKRRFGAQHRCDETWLVPRGPAGALLAARYSVRGRVKPRLRAA